MSAHTKGPWRIQHLGPQEADLFSGGTFMGLNGGRGAPDKYDPDDAAEWEANAALVVAAPDLLEALREFVEWADRNDWGTVPKALEAKMRAAISKAEHARKEAGL